MKNVFRGMVFENFSKAATAWLEDWSLNKGGCPHLAESLSDLPAESPEEWSKTALTNIPSFHCGNCEAQFAEKRHKLIVKRILEDVQKIPDESSNIWQINPVAKRRRKGKKSIWNWS